MQRHAGTAVGDGLRMAERAGAALTRLDRFYGHLLSRDAMHNDGLWPYPQIDAVATAGIVVDPQRQAAARRGARRHFDHQRPGPARRPALRDRDLRRGDLGHRGPGGANPAEPAACRGRRDIARGRHDRGARAVGRHRPGRPARHGGRVQQGGAQRARREIVAAALGEKRRSEADRDGAVLCDPDLRRHHEHVRRHRDRRARHGCVAPTAR